MIARRLVLLLVALLVLAACGGDEDQSAQEGGDGSEPVAEASEAEPATSEPADDTSEPAATTSEAAGGAIEVSDTDLGEILVDADGATLYVFDNDSDGTSNCSDDCAANWPPLTGDVTAGDGVDDGLLATTERDDGSTQVTYNGSPLYYFAGDQASGDTNGQAVGGIWWVVGADGEKITNDTSQADTGY